MTILIFLLNFCTLFIFWIVWQIVAHFWGKRLAEKYKRWKYGNEAVKEYAANNRKNAIKWKESQEPILVEVEDLGRREWNVTNYGDKQYDTTEVFTQLTVIEHEENEQQRF